MKHFKVVYFSIFLILLSLIVSQCSVGGDWGSGSGPSVSSEAPQGLGTLRGRVDDGLATSPIANARTLEGRGSLPLTEAITASYAVRTPMAGLLSSWRESPLVAAAVVLSVMSPDGARLLGQVKASFVPIATLDAPVTVLAQ